MITAPVVVRALCAKEDFNRVMHNPAIRRRNNWVILLASPNYVSCNRVGFILSRKRVPSAVLRNTIKRQVRQSIRDWSNQHSVIHFDLVVLIHRKLYYPVSEYSATTNRKILRTELTTLLNAMLRRFEKPVAQTIVDHRSS